jgi:hypothetical protein
MMITKTWKAVAVTSLAFATAVIGAQLTLRPAEAGSAALPGTPAYASARVDGAFKAVAEMLQLAEVRVPMATKGDLPAGLMCSGTPAECGVAYKALTQPSLTVASSFGNTTTLLRMDAIAVANIIDDVFSSSGSVAQ